MPVPMQKFREVVFQVLYSHDISRSPEDEMQSMLMQELEITKKTVREAQARARLIVEKLGEIDRRIKEASQSYEFERIQTVERNILRLGVYELFFDEAIPPKVAIAESIRLARKFSTAESATFINAVLDAIYKSSLGEKVDSSTMHDSIAQLQEGERIAGDAAKEKGTNSEIDL